MRLNPAIPVRAQIEQAKAQGVPFAFDLRAEAMGDKAASSALIRWLVEEFELDNLLILEAANGRTPFMLYDWFSKEGLSFGPIDFAVMGSHEESGMLDLHTTGQPTPCLWEFNAWLSMKGVRPKLIAKDRLDIENRDTIVFAIRTEAKSDQRKNMDLLAARETIDALRTEGFTVHVIHHKRDPLFPDALVLPMNEAIQDIANAKIFIGGDTGFSHVAAGFGIPTVAIYPDYARFGKGSLTKCERIAQWWEMPEMVWTPFNSLPNNNQLRVVELGTDHKWSIGHVIQSVKEFMEVENAS